MTERYLGIDVGAETLKVVELTRDGQDLHWTRRSLLEHHKVPGPALLETLRGHDWGGVAGAMVSGRLARQAILPRVPARRALLSGALQLCGDVPATVVSIGSHGFSVLEIRGEAGTVLRENSRCSQGTGNFLRHLVERFGLTIDEASQACADEDSPAVLSGRCPVILKTDMTHLANKGEDRARILAGLFDAVCENVQTLVRPSTPSPVLLAGGVARAPRVRAHFRRFLSRHGLALSDLPADDTLFLEALGCARLAADHHGRLPQLDHLWMPRTGTVRETVPALSGWLDRVRRMPPTVPAVEPAGARDLVLGFDVGSTGSKAVALDGRTGEVVWQRYLPTAGDPVGAAQSLMRAFVDSAAGRHPVRGVGATGSGREIAGSLLTVCYGSGAVHVANEIAAHAEGALHHDPRVDTIFEIGGQDAKFIRLAGGRVVDAALNEACSAGTGSFIEEQGRRFADIDGVEALGRAALAAPNGVTLGQHCSVFMAEVIDESVADDVPRASIIAGIYDSVVQNYLNRVKGSRPVGRLIFCQGMPFAADALAAAVARQTGSEVIVPPDPGTVGALGIALLTRKEVSLAGPALDPERFLETRVERKDVFACPSNRGCGGAGNKCRIDRLHTRTKEERRLFTWGGACSLHDGGTRRRKLPDLTPDPFRGRRELLEALVRRVTATRGGPSLALTEEFQLKGLFPFFATFFSELGLDLVLPTATDRAALKLGIERTPVPFCAPMQLYHGLADELAHSRADFLFLPMLRDLPRVRDEPDAVACPIAQASGDLLRQDLGAIVPRLLAPLIEIGPEGLASRSFHRSCRKLAERVGAGASRSRAAFRAALTTQQAFAESCLALGAEALDHCHEHGLPAVVVLGRTYTIHNPLLNANLPSLLREQGAVAIPVDCYPVAEDVPVFRDVYWGYAQVNLRAAHQVRRTSGVYGLYASTYSCGPDSFAIHSYGYAMAGKPTAIIETDGHAADAGTRTRVEAFLQCVREDLSRDAVREVAPSLLGAEGERTGIAQVRQRGETVLVPRAGPGAEAFAACLRGIGIPAESLPRPDRETVRLGRRHTSGKECLPMCLTLGSLLQRLERARDTEERFAFFMPTSSGPCRFGAYHTLHRIVLERLGWRDRARLWSPSFGGYFDGVAPGFEALVFTALVSSDILFAALCETRAAEVRRGAAVELYDRFGADLTALLERAGRGDLSLRGILVELAGGRLFGCADLLRQAAAAFAGIQNRAPRPSVLVVGEIYVRSDEFANDFIAEKLADRGIRARVAPFSEWLEYSDLMSLRSGRSSGLASRLRRRAKARIQDVAYATVAGPLHWPRRSTVRDALAGSAAYLREELEFESVLTLGGPLHEWRRGTIDGVISVGPLECMPNKIAEAQFFHAAQREGILSLTLALDGEPVDTDQIDGFSFEVQERFRERQAGTARSSAAGGARPSLCPAIDLQASPSRPRVTA